MSVSTITRSTILALNVQGAEVKALQRSLNHSLPFSYQLSEDGFFGQRTEAAVKYVQCMTGLTIDGIAGSQTIQFLNDYERPLPVLGLGSQGEHVKVVQMVLVAEGFLESSMYAIDGIYGKLTEEAVINFQRKIELDLIHRTRISGLVAAKTWPYILVYRRNASECIAFLTKAFGSVPSIPATAFTGHWSSEGNIHAIGRVDAAISISKSGRLGAVIRATKEGSNSGVMSLLATESLEGTDSVYADIFDNQGRIAGKVLLTRLKNSLNLRVIEATGIAKLAFPQISWLTSTQELSSL